MLLIGQESKVRIMLIIKLTDITSDNQIDALTDHYCKGYAKGMAAQLNNVLPTNFSKSIKSMNKAADIVEQIKELDWQGLRGAA